jgi:phytoene/squalene synthetase
MENMTDTFENTMQLELNRTKAALAQAERGMKGLEKTAKVTGKAINLAFGLITGGLLVSAFGKVAEAAKKTEPGAQPLPLPDSPFKRGE